ncbi:MAG: hypothetical protein COU40_00065 [Candidatus Moranbacteria bacterium CG10_big_fil_rev_8_21_14_0_10_35_21]|nr:MAG: hypothetical protein COU40_00065 [Candidatus Moranbacteria bacterium CG10_big_fil_rev_8_21_14_0_10_35_21]
MSEKNQDFYMVIMAGGVGTRLWPVSREKMPKQFQKFTSSKTMIQETYSRVARVVPKENIFVSTSLVYKKLVQQQLPGIKNSQLIIEPVARGTAPAIALVAKYMYKINPKAVVATIASDHAIKNVDEFVSALSVALQVSSEKRDNLITIGVKPTFAETGFGYIKMGAELFSVGKKKIFGVKEFLEKPDKKTAEKFLNNRKYLWNAGYFIFSAQDFLGWVKKLSPKINQALNKIEKEWGKKNPNNKQIEKIYSALKNQPVEPVIVEKLPKKNLLVVPSKMHWSDVGSWGALFDFFKEKVKSSMIVKGKHVDVNSQDCLVYAKEKLIATVGLKNIIIVETEDAILVADRNKTGEIKKIIEKLKKKGKHL